MTDVADLLANLIPQLWDLIGVHGVAGHEGHLRLAWARERDNALVLAGFHEFLLYALSDLTRHFFSGSTRPQRTDYHRFKSERWVFALSQLGVGEPAHNGQ